MKRLVVCCDGTWNTPDQKDRGVERPTNVVKLARWVLPQAPDGTEQKTYYDRGVGTGDFVDRLFGGAFGIGLSHNVREAYEFLSHAYAPGDEVYLFGFSRGAYTVRRTVGMLRKCGLAPKADKKVIQAAHAVYEKRESREEGGADSKAARAFREKHGAQRIPIRFLGVWDTVGSLGIAGVLGQLGSMMSRARFHAPAWAWVPAAAAVALFGALGQWQLGKGLAKQRMADAIRERAAEPEIISRAFGAPHGMQVRRAQARARAAQA